MLISFDQQPDYARVWIYQANRPLTDAEATFVHMFLENQTAHWAAHGQPLAGSVRVLHHRFVVVAVDGTQALPSGCSIDASTRWLKDLGAEMNLDFFDRSVAFLQNDVIQTLPVSEAKKSVAEGKLTPETTVFNNLVPTLGEFRKSWQVPAAQSWLG
ncbi:MAG: hypothetical protein H7Y12_16170, partial [Sphingobacteriaceae bacterium]|nr:hypothetical protein [Cytophagaceae bacterium]